MRRAGACAGFALALALAACVSVPPGEEGRPGDTGARNGGGLFEENAVLVTRFTDVAAVAASRRYVFAVGTAGLAVYDAQFNRWLPPLLTGGGVAWRPTALAADPVSDAVWIGGIGEIVYYQPSSNFSTRVALPGVVDEIFFDEADPGAGAYVRAGGGWSRVTTVGTAGPALQLPPPARRVSSADLQDVLARWPALRDLGGNITRDEQQRTWPIASGTITPGRSEVFLGTLGNGLYRVDPDFMRGQHIPFGLIADGGGALALATDGVWVAPTGMGTVTRARGGLTFVRDDLQEWRWIEDDWNGSLAGSRAFDLSLREGIAWIATDRGLARLDTRSRSPSVPIWSLLSGLPSDRVYAVAPRPGGAWAGTERGLVWVSDTGRRVQATASRVDETIAAGVAVRALLSAGDTLWMGTESGLLLLRPGGDRRPVRSAMQQEDPRLGGPVRALAASDSIVLVGLDADIARVNVRTGTLLPRLLGADVGVVGRVTSLAIDGRTMWIGGTRGLLAVDRASAVSRFLPVSDDLTSEPYDIVLHADWAWVGTRDGVLRLARRRDGLPR